MFKRLFAKKIKIVDLSVQPNFSFEEEVKNTLTLQGMQGIICGPNNEKKVNLLKAVFEREKVNYIVTACSTGTTHNLLMKLAMEELQPYFELKKERKSIIAGAVDTYNMIAKDLYARPLSRCDERTKEVKQKFAYKTGANWGTLSMQSLAEFFGAVHVVWVISDFQLMSAAERSDFYQYLKLFRDVAADFKHLTVFVLSENNSFASTFPGAPPLKGQYHLSEIPNP
jgi:hypothetical protein